jgi:hypothetical protein
MIDAVLELSCISYSGKYLTLPKAGVEFSRPKQTSEKWQKKPALFWQRKAGVFYLRMRVLQSKLPDVPRIDLPPLRFGFSQ